ncbi:MAG: lipopolysaccharide biosynthesis protein [Phycisphaerae bacterium]
MPEIKEQKPPSRRAATIGNLVSQYAAIVLVVVNGILLVPLYLAKIDYVLYSAWLATGNVLAWLSLAEGNMNLLIRREVACAYGQRQAEELGQAIGTGLVVNGLVGLFPTLIGMFVAWFLPGWLGLSGNNSGELILAVSLAAVSVGLTVAAGAPGSVQQGLQRNIAHCAIFIFAAIMGIAATVLLLYKGWGVLAIPTGLIVRFALENLVRWPYVFYLTKVKLGVSISFSWGEVRRIFRLTLWTLIEKLGQRLVLNLDAFVVGVVMDVTLVPIVVLTKRAWDVVYMLTNRLGVAIMPSLAHIRGEGQDEKFRLFSRRLLNIVGVSSGVMLAVTIAVNKNFMRVWLSRSDLYAGDLFNILLGLAMFSLAFANNVRQPLFAAGFVKEVSLVSIVQSLARAVTLVGLMYWIGIYAVPVSLLLTVPLVGGAYMLGLLKRELHFSSVRLTKTMAEICITIVACTAIGFVLTWLPDTLSWAALSMKGLAILLGTTILLLLLTPSGWRLLRKKFVSRTGRVSTVELK